MVEIKTVPYDEEHKHSIQSIRQHVFCVEQGIDRELEFDGLDSTAIHVIASVNGQTVATGRMLSDGHIGRIAVLSEYRRLGIGSNIVLSLIDEATNNGYSSVYLGSQKHAIDFYVELGFTPVGEPFMEAGLEHLSMEKSLT
ncbi:GNAT family N-acetyltransferase [Vibrio sp. RC27]